MSEAAPRDKNMSFFAVTPVSSFQTRLAEQFGHNELNMHIIRQEGKRVLAYYKRGKHVASHSKGIGIIFK
jgi:hypothetical protein